MRQEIHVVLHQLCLETPLEEVAGTAVLITRPSPDTLA
jgi:hypothetical protein